MRITPFIVSERIENSDKVYTEQTRDTNHIGQMEQP